MTKRLLFLGWINSNYCIYYEQSSHYICPWHDTWEKVYRLKITSLAFESFYLHSLCKNTHIPRGLMEDYYEQRTTNGGLLITEATFISKDAGAYPHVPGVFSPEQVISHSLLLSLKNESLCLCCYVYLFYLMSLSLYLSSAISHHIFGVYYFSLWKVSCFCDQLRWSFSVVFVCSNFLTRRRY